MRQLALSVVMASNGVVTYQQIVLICQFLMPSIHVIGAADDLISGQSTFMVEMMEANQAIKRATPNSLIIF